MYLIESEDPPTADIFLRYMFQHNMLFPKYCVFIAIDSNTGDYLLELIKRYISISGNGDMFTFQSNFAFCKSEDLKKTIGKIDSDLFSGFDALWFFDVLPESINYKNMNMTNNKKGDVINAIGEFMKNNCVLCVDEGLIFRMISTKSYWMGIKGMFLEYDVVSI